MKYLVLLLSLVVFSNAANAKGFFDGVSTKLGKCYSRAYSADHLKKHPKQTVTHMSAKLHYMTWTYTTNNDQVVTEKTPILKLQAKVKGKSDVFGVELACGKDGRCFIECDGPRTQIKWSQSKTDSILIDNKDGGLTLEPITCDSMTEEELAAANIWLKGIQGGDDIFRLDPMPDYQCL